MDYLGDKLNSLTSEAVTGINELKRKRKLQSQKQPSIDKQQSFEETPLGSMSARQQASESTNQPTAPMTTGIYGFDLDRIRRGPLSGGVAFGGDSKQQQAPAVGFLMPADADDTSKDDHAAKPMAPGHQQDHGEEGSSLSLYEGDTWSRLWFQRVMVLTLIRLMLFIRKVYEDYKAFSVYRVLGLTGHCFIAAATLFLPTLVFTIYRVARYLQIALPSVRPPSSSPVAEHAHQQQQQRHKTDRDMEDTQSRRALMSSPTESLPKQRRQQSEPPVEEDGLATARHTPTNLNEEQFHDTQSEQQIQIIESTRAPAASADVKGDSSQQPGASVYENDARKLQEPRLESVDVNKLGNLPDKHTTRIILGASEQVLHGILFIFWQLKRQVDVVGYLVERSCLWRRPKETEKQQLVRLRFSGDGLEWFQDFYAAFLAILVQVYSLGTHWADDGTGKRSTNGTSVQRLSGVGFPASTLLTSPAESSEGSASTSARVLSSLLGSGVMKNGDDILITSEIIVSCMVVMSLLIAVRRQDDGPLTLGLSMLGWGSIFAARIIAVALAFVHIGWHIMLPLVLCHIVAISVWIYKIALDSHNGKPDESEEYRWDPTAAADSSATIEDAPGEESSRATQSKGDHPTAALTSSWSTMEHLTLVCQVITLFAIPSLFYWPIMFNLKLHARPFKYLALILSENFILIAAIWYDISSKASSSTVAQWYLLGTIGACSIVGFIFIALYIACKPTLTEYFARADEILNQADKCGIYYEFCSRVFRMPDLTKHAFRRLMNQHEEVVTRTIVEENDDQTMTDVQLD